MVRGGYGVFFDSFETREMDDSGDIYPFVVRASPNPTTDPTLPKLTDNLFPPVSLHAVSPATDGSQFFAVIISEKPRNPVRSAMVACQCSANLPAIPRSK